MASSFRRFVRESYELTIGKAFAAADGFTANCLFSAIVLLCAHEVLG